MTNYVSLSTDPAPTYAALSPVTARLWRRHGWTPVFHVLDDPVGWGTQFGLAVLAELEAAGAFVARVARVDPLSVPNAMRVARLLAAGLEFVAPDDFVVMADVDMWPLIGSFFAPDADDVTIHARRGLYHAWTNPEEPLPPVPPERLHAANWRFAMCYVGARAFVWRERLPLDGDTPTARLRALLAAAVVPDQPDVTNAALVPGMTHFVELDERILARAILGSPRSAGPLVGQGRGRWQQGELLMTDPVDAPQLTGHVRLARGLQMDSTRYPRDAFDFITPRFHAEHVRPWHCLDIARAVAPELDGWLTDWRHRAEAAITADEGTLWPEHVEGR